MTKDQFLRNVTYAIDRYNKRMTIFYENIPIETIIKENNLSYNPANEEIAEKIALESELFKKLINEED